MEASRLQLQRHRDNLVGEDDIDQEDSLRGSREDAISRSPAALRNRKDFMGAFQASNLS